MLFIVAAGCRRLGRIGADRLHIAGNLPDLFGRHLVAERGHAVRPSVADRGVDRDTFGTVIPPAIEKSWTDAALSIAVAGLAAEPGIQPLALTEIIGVVLVGLIQCEIDFRWGAADAV